METESEKTSYTLKHPADETNDEPKTETYEIIDEDSALLSLTEPDKPAEADETTALTDDLKSEETTVDPEDLTKKDANSQSLKDKFLKLFDRKKPNAATDAPNEAQQNGDTPHPTTAAEEAPQTTTKKRFLPPIKIKNPFMKKSESSTPIAPAENPENPEENGEKGDEATEVQPVENGEEKKETTTEVNEEKPKVANRITSALSSITLPNISGIVNRFKRSPQSPDDIEMGNGKKAGLASMETLDDSTKDPWSQESETVDGKSPEKAAEEKIDTAEKRPSILDSLRGYACSIDDIALLIGLLIFVILVVLILSFTFLGTSKPTKIAPVRDGKVITVTSCGKVEGLVEDSSIAFRGIPFAVPPTGIRRFESAKPINNLKYCWNGTLKAHNASNECIQLNNEGKIEGSEDCLTLDVVTPQVRNYNLLPVIVLIGADSYLGGQPGVLRPSARWARLRDVVYVRPKFRNNVFGYLALETLSNSSRVPTSGNYALSDIIVALEWIKTNIHNFGGDPTSVLLFGHRTGATLVTALTSSPKASKLFDRAWASSPSAIMPGKSLEDLEKQNLNYANNFKECGNKTCWQNQEARTLIEKMPESWKRSFANVLPKIGENYSSIHQFLGIDGVIIKKHPHDSWANIPNLSSKLVIGTTKHASYDISEGTTISSEGIYQLVNDSKIGEAGLTDKALELYGQTVEGLVSMISDIRTICPLLVLARSQNNIPFYIVTQTRGENNLADVSSDVEAILGRYKIDESPMRRYSDSIRNFFFYYVYHGKIAEYSQQNFVLNVGQDVIAKSDYPICDFWINNSFVPHYAAI